MSVTSPLTTEDENVPTRFAELGDDVASEGCRFCGKPATHRLQFIASLQQSTGRGPAKRAAGHKQDYCETHAVQLFVKVKKVMR